MRNHSSTVSKRSPFLFSVWAAKNFIRFSRERTSAISSSDLEKWSGASEELVSRSSRNNMASLSREKHSENVATLISCVNIMRSDTEWQKSSFFYVQTYFKQIKWWIELRIGLPGQWATGPVGYRATGLPGHGLPGHWANRVMDLANILELSRYLPSTFSAFYTFLSKIYPKFE